MGTSKSGYIQRRIVKVCEDIKVQYDGTVRDATGRIYQFVYGNNGFDATKTIRVDGKPYFCDISRLTDRLNTAFELGLNELQNSNEPEITYTTVRPPKMDKKVNTEKKELIDKIKKVDPTARVSEKCSLFELRQYLESLVDIDVEAEIDEEETEEEREELSEEEKEDNEDEEKEKEEKDSDDDDKDEMKMFVDDDDEYNEPDYDDAPSDFED